MVKEVDALKAKIKERLDDFKPDYKAGLSSGSTLINLACTGKSTVAFLPGFFYLVVGNSNSGKTFLTLAVLAEATINPKFADYRLIYDAVERGNQMDLKKLFGSKLVNRITPPARNKDGQAQYSATVEEFFFNLTDCLSDGPCIYILDSEDALTSLDEMDKFEELKEAHRKGKNVTGSYGMSKAKFNSAGCRLLISKLAETKSILLIISQTRDAIGFGAQFNPDTRSGGRALTFYATIELWTKLREKLVTTYKGKTEQVGILSQVKIKRSRFTGRERTIEVPIYFSCGVDDIGSMVDFLVEWKRWEIVKDKTKKDTDEDEDKPKKNKKACIEAADFHFQGLREDLIQKIQDDGKERELQLLVAEEWGNIEAACEVKRRNKYQS